MADTIVGDLASKYYPKAVIDLSVHYPEAVDIPGDVLYEHLTALPLEQLGVSESLDLEPHPIAYTTPPTTPYQELEFRECLRFAIIEEISGDR